MNKNFIYLFFIVSIASAGLFSCANKNQTFATKGEPTQNAAQENRTYSKLAQDLLMALKNSESTKLIEEKLAKADVDELVKELDTDAKRMAFWVNIYNGFIQVVLKDNPKLYEDRGSFFKKDQVKIAGSEVSFDKIEHGVIRSSTSKLSKGYIPKIFAGKFEKTFRLSNRDGRIHFVLNCGAKDCPPVYIFDAATLNEDFDKVASEYLKRITEVDTAKKEIKTTPLFQWFTGDFGIGKKGVKNLLAKYKIITEKEKDFGVEYKSYDWTLDLGNFGEQILSNR